MNEVEKPIRLYFVDNIRILLTIVVIMHHTMITYGASGSWYFKDPKTDEFTIILLSIIALLDQGFFMGLFFFISAYFVPGSYNRKGPVKFLKDRFIRLGIPLIIYTIIVGPLIKYFVNIEPTYGITFIEFYLSYFQSWELFGEFLGGNGPLWFVLALLIFDVFYTLWRQINNGNFKNETEKKPPKNIQLVLVAILMAIFTFIIRLFFLVDGGDTFFNIQLCFVAQYIVMLILGTIAYNRDWFRNIPNSQGKVWLIIVLILIISLLPLGILLGAYGDDTEKFRGGLNWQAFIFNIWESFYCIGMCIGLVVLFRNKFNTQGNASKSLSQNAYTMYIVHAPVLVFIAMLFSLILMPALLKFIIVFPFVLGICFLISHFILRRIPGSKKVLG
ncbi:MAG: acyltransferase family protein [Candidatus Hermodarchaeota archaeon]